MLHEMRSSCRAELVMHVKVFSCFNSAMHVSCKVLGYCRIITFIYREIFYHIKYEIHMHHMMHMYFYSVTCIHHKRFSCRNFAALLMPRRAAAEYPPKSC